MFLRLLFLISLLGAMGPDARPDEENEPRMGGEGFGNIVMIVLIVGVVLLVAVVGFAILALTGQFENTAMDPPV